LSVAYTAVAEELSTILAAVQAGAWEGPSAEQYVAAHVPYVMWLVQAGADSAVAAVKHETAAAAHVAALAAMPTLAELAANHATNAALLATNFFGINTIPIAINEAEYVWMWIQAAATMAQYDLTSSSAVATAPRTIPPPHIVKTTQSSDSSDTGGAVLDIVDNDSGDPYDLSWWVNRFLEVPQTLGRDALEFPQNPSLATAQLESDIPGLIADEVGHAAEAYEAFFPQINALAAGLPAVNPVLFGLAGLDGVPGIQPDVTPAAPAAPLPEVSATPVAGSSPPVSAAAAPAPTAAPASAPAPAPAPAPAAPAPPAPPSPGIGGGGFPYLVGGPRMGAGAAMGTGARRKAPEPDVAAAAAAAGAAARQRERSRRRRRAAMKSPDRGYRYEFLGQEPGGTGAFDDEAERVVVSSRGAGALGFAGTAASGTPVEASGLAKVAGDGFGGGPSVPMVPGSWEPDATGSLPDDENHVQ
jgi:PPE-repeat protein